MKCLDLQQSCSTVHYAAPPEKNAVRSAKSCLLSRQRTSRLCGVSIRISSLPLVVVKMKGPKGPISPYVGPVVILVVGLFVRFPVVRHR